MLYVINEHKTNFDENLLSSIREKRNKKEVKRIVENFSLWNSSDTSEATLLHYTAESNNADVAEYLLESGSKIDAQNCRGQTPLILALEKKHQKVIKVLLRAGADLEICDDSNRNALQVVIDEYETMDDDIAQLTFQRVRKDCFNDSKRIADKLLEAGWPVYSIVLLGNSGVTRSILQRDCSINTYFTENNREALMEAIETTVEEDICALLQAATRKAAQRFPIVQEEHNLTTTSGTRRKLYREHSEESNFELFRVKREWKIIAMKDPGITSLSLDTQYAVACTVDYLLYEGAEFDATSGNICLPIYHAFQTFSKYEDIFKLTDSIWGVLLKLNFFIFGELLLAYLGLYETFGTPIPESLHSEIDTNVRLKNYFNFCKRLLSKKVYESVTLFKLLTEDVGKLTHLAYNQEFAKAITCFNRRLKSESYYFHISFQRRIEKLFMRAVAVDVLCELLQINCRSLPNVGDTVLSYLTDRDVLRMWNLRHIVLPSSGRRKARRILSGFSTE